MSRSIEVRRHAERASARDDVGSLSRAGHDMARRLRQPERSFALVISSSRERARDTAMAIADRVDEVDDVISGSPDDALTQAQYDSMRSQAAVMELLAMSAPSRRFAEGQVAFWERVAGRIREGETALIVTHGGNIELAAALVASRLDTHIGALPLGYCEGVRVLYERGAPVGIERIPAG